MEFLSIEEVRARDGLRLVLLQGLPSPWGQAAKTMMEMKSLEFAMAPQIPGGSNDALVAWVGENSAPAVAWNDEPPLTRWLDILFLLERLAPEPRLIPQSAEDRVTFFGLCHEICGELGLGWNRRLQMFAPALAAPSMPPELERMGSQYGLNDHDVALAGGRIAQTLDLLTRTLEKQNAMGSNFFITSSVTALDIYWTAFANLLDPLPADKNPMPESRRPGFVVTDPLVTAALDPLLIAHRDRIFDEFFRCPMEY